MAFGVPSTPRCPVTPAQRCRRPHAVTAQYLWNTGLSVKLGGPFTMKSPSEPRTERGNKHTDAAGSQNCPKPNFDLIDLRTLKSRPFLAFRVNETTKFVRNAPHADRRTEAGQRGTRRPQPIRALPPRSAAELRPGFSRTAATASAGGAQRNAAAGPRPPPGERREPGPLAEPPPGSRRAPDPSATAASAAGREGQAEAAALPAGLELGGREGGARRRPRSPPRPARRPPASSGAGGAILAAFLLPGERRRGRTWELHVARRERRRRSRDAERPLPPAAPEALPAGGTGWRRAAPGVTASGGRRRAVLTRRREQRGAERSRPGPARPHHGGQAAHPHGTSPRPRCVGLGPGPGAARGGA